MRPLADPSDYFERRPVHLLTLASQSDAELRSKDRSLKYGTLELRVVAAGENDPDEEAHRQFILTESEMLVHHLGETLLRMFLAHAADPPAPWLEIAKLRGPAEFKRKLNAILSPPETAQLRGHVSAVLGAA